MSTTSGKPSFWLVFGSIVFAALLSACSDGNNNNNPAPLPPPVDPEFPDYTVVTVEPGDDPGARALEALISAEPKTIIELPAGTCNLLGELSSSVDNIVMRGQGMTADGVTFRRLRVEWTNGPDENNGPYGLHPVQTRNVLIEDCEARVASDAGLVARETWISTSCRVTLPSLLWSSVWIPTR